MVASGTIYMNGRFGTCRPVDFAPHTVLRFRHEGRAVNGEL